MSAAAARAVSRRHAAAALQAYVLHRYDWSETSLIVELFTRERGRVVVVAKGAKRPYSQLRPVLLPFQRISVQLGRTPADEASEIHTLRSAEWAGGVPALAAGALFHGFYANELLLKTLARQDPHEALFDAYAEMLPLLGGAQGAAAALRAYELQLLAACGWLPALDAVSSTRQPLQGGRCYALDAQSGVVQAAGDALPAAALRAAQQALDAQDPAALRRACGAPAAVWRDQLRGVLQYHLGSAPLRSRQVMHELQRLLEPRGGVNDSPRDETPR